MTAEMYHCPAEGCDYGPMPLESVAAHYSGTTAKPDHKGGYEQAKTRILGSTGDAESSQDTEVEPQSGTESDTEAQQAREESSSGSGGNPPSMETPPVESRGDGTGQSQGPKGCPDCGGELVDYRDEEHVPGNPNMLTPFDYLCSECHKTWDDS